MRAQVLASCALLAAPAVGAHEFWMQPESFRVQPGEPVTLSLLVGENFEGGKVALSQPLFLRLAQQLRGRAIDLRPQVPAAGNAGDVTLPLQGTGTQLLWADTQPSHLELEAGRFFAYLHDEGLDAINTLREARGQLATPGRERFRRHVKTLIRVEGAATAASEGAATQRTGQMLEIVPLSDPSVAAAGRPLAFQVIFDGKPLRGALVKFWHRRGAQTAIVRTTTGIAGQVSVELPWRGTWMASVVHMTEARERQACDCEWESYWGNLTFELPEPR